MKTYLQYSLIGLFVILGSSLQAQDLNDLLTELNNTKEESQKASLLKQIGLVYQKQQAYPKAIDYLQQSLELEQKKQSDESQFIPIRQNLAFCYSQLKDYPKAIYENEAILKFHKQQDNKKSQLLYLNELAQLNKLNKNFTQAIAHTQENLQINQQLSDQAGIQTSHNNLGYLYNEIGEYSKSLENYQKALQVSKQFSQMKIVDSQKATLQSNTGVTYSYLRDFKTANQYFENALGIYEKEGNISQQAHAQNYIAANHYISGKNDLAIAKALKGLELATTADNQEATQESYQILAEAYQKNGDFKEAQKYTKLMQEMKDKIAEQTRKNQQKILEEQLNIERKENELKQLIADKEKQTLALKQSELERVKQEQDLKLKENEVALLKRNQELQASALRNQLLEKDKVQQLLEITRQKSIADKERLLAENQKAEAARQKLIAEKNRVVAEKEQKAREASEEAQLAQKKQLDSEKSLRQYSYLIIGLVGIVALLILIGLLNSRKATKKLRNKNEQIQMQKEEIESANEELHQNQEEILAQRDFIEQKNNELEEYNRHVKSSINAAMTIQKAILPYEEKLDKLLKEHFLIFRPKDVVSGDFFWLNVIDGLKILVTADCTGHGVPGAFMTLIGNTLLDKIVRVWKITMPDEILTKLHEEIRTVLRQEATQNNNGMDANVIAWKELQDDKVHVQWAGAKQNLFYIQKDSNKIEILKGTRKAIGGEQNEKIFFQSHTFEVPKNTLFFMGTDGLTDQNDKLRRRFGEQKLINLLEQTQGKASDERKKIIENALDEHMSGTAQRDDILWIGFSV